MSLRLRRLAVAAVLAVTIIATTTTSPAAADAGFGDVWPGRYYTHAVQWMVDEGITNGVTPARFGPADAVTCGQAAAFLWRMEEKPTPAGPHGFDDVAQPWQQTPVAWMVEQGITLGVTPSMFEPERAISRAEFAVLLWRLAGPPTGSPPPGFLDVPPGAFFERAVAWMVEQRITNGTSATTFSPGATITRAEVATFLYRYAGSPSVTVDPAGAPCAIEYQPGVELRVYEPPACPAGGSPVVMTGGPNSSVFSARFPALGYLHVDVDYRNPGSTGSFGPSTLRAFTWSVSDLATAVRWVRANAGSLCADPERIAAVGYSYGAITALSLAYTFGELSAGDTVEVDELGDPVTVGDAPPGPPPELAGFSPDIQAAVSVAGFVLADTIDAGEPPSLLFHSPTDTIIPFSLGWATCEAAAAAGVTCELVTYVGGHDIATDAVVAAAHEFLEREMG